MNLFGATAVSRTRIEHQVEIVQIRPTFGQVAADHSDAAKAYDAVVLAKSGGLDIAKRHRCRQVVEPHEPSSPSRGRGATAHRHHRNPAEACGAGGVEERKRIKVRRPSAHPPSVQVKILALLPG